jgi:hypothetical protein
MSKTTAGPNAPQAAPARQPSTQLQTAQDEADRERDDSATRMPSSQWQRTSLDVSRQRGSSPVLSSHWSRALFAKAPGRAAVPWMPGLERASIEQPMAPVPAWPAIQRRAGGPALPPVQRLRITAARVAGNGGISHHPERLRRVAGPVPIQRRRSDAAASPLPPPGPGRGQPMPGSVRAKMERAFRTDFAAVRIYEGPQAPAVGALAYTQGADIHFAPGQYQPDSQRGQELLGHELAHVVQQAQGRVRAPGQAARVSINDDAGLEREADVMGARAARGELATSGHATSAPRVAARNQQSQRPATLLAQALKARHGSLPPIIQRMPAVSKTLVDSKPTKIGQVEVNESNGAMATVTPQDYGSGSETVSAIRVVSRAATRAFGQSFIAGHMLNNHLGGPGNDQANITAITSSQNALHKNRLENHAKKEVNGNKKTIDYCTVIAKRADFALDGKVLAENLASELVGGYAVHGGSVFPAVTIPLGPTAGNVTKQNERSTGATCDNLSQQGQSAPGADGGPGAHGNAPESSGTITAKVAINPTLELTFDRPPALGKISIASPPIKHPGMHASSVTLDIDGRKAPAGDGEGKTQAVLALSEGSMAVGVDMGGAVSSKGDQQLPLVPDEASPRLPDVVHTRAKHAGEHHFGGLTSRLDEFFKDRVTTSADLTDEGMLATLTVSAGPLGQSSLELQESSITATMGKDGLKLAGNVGISDHDQRIQGNLGVSWSNGGLTIEGSATVSNVIAGLEPFTAKITYDRAASGVEGLALGVDKVAFKKDMGAIPFTGEARDLKYDFKTGAFSGDARLTGDLGALGQVAAATTIANNEIQRADLAYEKSPIDLPQQNPVFSGALVSNLTYEKEALSGTIGGSATLKLPALQRLGNSDQPIAMNVEARVADGAIGGTFTLQTPVQLGPYFRITELGANVGQQGGFGMNGSLELESGIFQPGRVAISYQDGKLSGRGEVGIAKGKIIGVDSATIAIGIDGDKIDGAGTLVPSVRQIQQGAVTFSYSPTKGISLGGSLALASGIPYLKAAAVDFRVGKLPGAASYDVSAGGTLDIEVPGLKASARASYANGAFTIEGTAPYKAGKLVSGNVTVGVTNRLIDAQGNPTDQIGENLVPYGQGSVTLTLAPWLQGKAGIRLLPNGELEIHGELAIPPRQFFARKGFAKTLLSIGIDIPILGVAVAGQRIGIFATVGGSVTLDASVGPGVLRNTRLNVTYNHARPEQTKIGGKAAIHVPAEAGVRLAIRGALGAGIPIVSASLGLEASGRLGINGALDAGIDLAWTPARGLSFDALGKISAQPKVTFDLTGYALVEADLLVKKLELYRKNWRLASFQYGPAMRLGMSFPIHYDAEQGLVMSWDRVKFEEPKLDVKSLLAGLVDKIK